VKKGGFRLPISCYLFRTTNSENNASRAEAALKNPLLQPPPPLPPPPAGSMVMLKGLRGDLRSAGGLDGEGSTD
jgi:hypothetical protein